MKTRAGQNPAESILANRTFLARSINEGVRDIVINVNYRTTGSIPADTTLPQPPSSAERLRRTVLHRE